MNQIIKSSASDLLTKLQEDSIDLVLTDPPYDFFLERCQKYYQEFKRVSKTGFIVFCSPEMQWPHTSDLWSINFWIKPISTKNTIRRYSRFVEMIMMYGNLKWNHERHWSQYTNVFQDLVDGNSNHPYEKPTSLIKRLLLNHSDVGDLILDPFCGSGTICQVAKSLDRSYLGCDLRWKE